MSYYYQGTSLSTICNYITSAQDNVQNLKIAKKTDYTSLGITETPTKTGFYNATHTDYSTFCIAYYTENQLVSIPSWCRQLRIVMIGGGGSGTTYQGGDHQHVNAVNTHTMTHDHVATVHTHTAQHKQQAAVQQSGTAAHTHVGQHQNHEASHADVPWHADHIHYQDGGQYDMNGQWASYRPEYFNIDNENEHHKHILKAHFHYAAWSTQKEQQQVDQTGTQVHQAAVQQDQQQNQQDQQGHQTDTQNTQQDVPVQHKDTPTAGAGGGGGAFVYISTFQVSNVTSPSMSASSNNVYLSFTTGGTNYSIVANGGGNMR